MLPYFFSKACDTIGCRLIFCGWKAKVSTRLQVSKFDKAHYQVLCGIQPSDDSFQGKLVEVMTINNYSAVIPTKKRKFWCICTAPQVRGYCYFLKSAVTGLNKKFQSLDIVCLWLEINHMKAQLEILPCLKALPLYHLACINVGYTMKFLHLICRVRLQVAVMSATCTSIRK